MTYVDAHSILQYIVMLLMATMIFRAHTNSHNDIQYDPHQFSTHAKIPVKF